MVLEILRCGPRTTPRRRAIGLAVLTVTALGVGLSPAPSAGVLGGALPGWADHAVQSGGSPSISPDPARPGELLTVTDQAVGCLEPDSATTAAGSTFLVLWDGKPLGTGEYLGSDVFELRAPVPGDAQPGSHEVSVDCQYDGHTYYRSEGVVEVVAPPQPPPPQPPPPQPPPPQPPPPQPPPPQPPPPQPPPPQPPPAPEASVVVVPSRAQPGDSVRVRGSGHDRCASATGRRGVLLSWGQEPARQVRDLVEGTFAVDLRVPTAARPGRHTISTSCLAGGGVVASAGVTVRQVPPPPTTGPLGTTPPTVVPPSTRPPTLGPTARPTSGPTGRPTLGPTARPSVGPTTRPTGPPTARPPGTAPPGVQPPTIRPRPTTTPIPTVPPSLRVLGEARTGARVTVVAQGHTACHRGPEPSAQLRWDGRIPVAAASVSAAGSFRVELEVPEEVGPGRHELVSYCRVTATVPADGMEEALPDPVAEARIVPAVLPVQAVAEGEAEEDLRRIAAVPVVVLPAAGTAEEQQWARAPISLLLLRPADIDYSPSSLLFSLGLAALLALLVGFPAELFNSTVKQNQEEIRGWFGRLPRRSLPGSPGVKVALFALAGALLMSLASHDVALTGRHLATFVGALVAVPVVLLAFEVPVERYCRRVGGGRAVLAVVPVAIPVAVALAAVSRLLPLEPVYVYGLIAAYVAVAGRQLTAAGEGAAVLRGVASVLALAAVAYVPWTLVAGAVEQEGPLPRMVADAVLGSIVFAALELPAFALVPLTFLDGSRVMAWSRSVWAVAYTVSVFGFVHVVLRRSLEATVEHPPRVLAVLLPFLAFAAFSTAFWGWFRYRPAWARPVAAAGQPVAGDPGEVGPGPGGGGGRRLLPRPRPGASPVPQQPGRRPDGPSSRAGSRETESGSG